MTSAKDSLGRNLEGKETGEDARQKEERESQSQRQTQRERETEREREKRPD